MVHLRNLTIPAAIAMLVCLAFSQAVSAEPDHDGVREKFPKDPVELECGGTAVAPCLAPSAGNQATVPIKLAKKELPIQRICFTLRFVGDLVEAGERVGIALTLDPSASFFGFENPGPAPTSERTVCLTAEHEELIDMLSVKKTTIYVFMVIGSATLSDVEVSLNA